VASYAAGSEFQVRMGGGLAFVYLKFGNCLLCKSRTHLCAGCSKGNGCADANCLAKC